VVTLDFEGGILNCAARAELHLQLLEERLPFLLRHLETLDDRDGLPASAFPLKPDSYLLLRRTQACMENLFNGLLFPRDNLVCGVD